MIPVPEQRRISHALLSHPYRFAKTMPGNPHWYTLRKEWDSDEFDAVVEGMRRYGYPEWYGGRLYTMFNVNGYKYWTMGALIDQTILINRKLISGVEAPYDAIAPAYDEAFSDPDSLDEDRRLMALIGDTSTLSVLDVGSGTGLFLDHNRPRDYVGIDPSQVMNDRLAAKHPDYADRVLRCPLEEYVGGPFDLVVCLYDAYYLRPDHVEAIPDLLVIGGRWFVMYAAPGYRPVTYERTGVSVQPRFEASDVSLPGERFRFGNFVVIDGHKPC